MLFSYKSSFLKDLVMPPKVFGYVLRNLCNSFFLSLTALISFVFIIQFLKLSSVIFSNQTAFYIFLKIFSLLILSYLPILIPFCLLFSILFGYELLSQNSELVILGTFGYSKLQISSPAILMGLLSLFVSIYTLNTLGPMSNYWSDSMKRELKRNAAVFAITPGSFINRIPNYLLYIQSKNQDGFLKTVFINYDGDDRNKFSLFADTGKVIVDDIGLIGIELNNGTMYSLLRDGVSNVKLLFKKYQIKFFLSSKESANTTVPISNKTTTNLLKSVKSSKDTKNIFKIKKEIIKRYISPFSCLFFLFIGALLSIRLHSQVSKGSGIFLAFGFFAVFWISMFIGEYLTNLFLNLYFMSTPILVSLIVSYTSWLLIQKKEIT